MQRAVSLVYMQRAVSLVCYAVQPMCSGVPCCKSDDMSENVTDTVCLLLWLNTKN